MALLELVDYINTPQGQKAANAFRALPPKSNELEVDDDEPVLEPSWPHLQVVYEFLLRFVVSSEVKAKPAKKYVNQQFCLQLIELFDSEDPRERDYLKTILHRIYGKFMIHRSFIRKAIANVFYRVVFETGRHNGIGELLEILGSIINGYALPLKEEHVVFLRKALLPLHRPKILPMYHQQLSYCITQYVEKDPNTAVPILRSLIRNWPWSKSPKQLLLLNEVEEILELIGPEQLDQVSGPLFRTLARCLGSDHFQVAERTLFLWNNDHLLNHGCLSHAYSDKLLPAIFRPLMENSTSHWSPIVAGLAKNVLRHYEETKPDLFERVRLEDARREEEERKREEVRQRSWEEVEAMAREADPTR